MREIDDIMSAISGMNVILGRLITLKGEMQAEFNQVVMCLGKDAGDIILAFEETQAAMQRGIIELYNKLKNQENGKTQDHPDNPRAETCHGTPVGIRANPASEQVQ